MADKKETSHAPDMPELSDAERKAALKEGAKEAVRETGRDTAEYLRDSNLPDAEPARQFLGSDEIMPFAPLLDLGADALEERIGEKSDRPVPEEKVAGLLALERAGQNRTEHVKVLCKRLGVKSPYEVTSAGPPFTNDTSNVTEVTR